MEIAEWAFARARVFIEENPLRLKVEISPFSRKLPLF